MKTLKAIVVLSTFVLASAITARAADATSAQLTQLRDTKERLATKAGGEKGYPRMQLDLERRRVADLIDDLEAGKSVDPNEIDRVLNHARPLSR